MDGSTKMDGYGSTKMDRSRHGRTHLWHPPPSDHTKFGVGSCMDGQMGGIFSGGFHFGLSAAPEADGGVSEEGSQEGSQRYLSGISAASQEGSRSRISRGISKSDLKLDFRGLKRIPAGISKRISRTGSQSDLEGINHQHTCIASSLAWLTWGGDDQRRKETRMEERKAIGTYLSYFACFLQQSSVWHFGIIGRRRPGHLLRDIMGSDDTWGMIIAWI